MRGVIGATHATGKRTLPPPGGQLRPASLVLISQKVKEGQ
jgi:hypothetical protein